MRPLGVMRLIVVMGVMGILGVGLSASAVMATGHLADEPLDQTWRSDVKVPGTEAPDLLASANRTWSLVEGGEVSRPVLEGVADDARLGAIAVQVFADLGMVEAVLVRSLEDDGVQVVFNVGAALSSIRLDPPLQVAGSELETIDVPRLTWSEPEWSNMSAGEWRLVVLRTSAVVPAPDENGTSPPVGAPLSPSGDGDPADGNMLRLTWTLSVTERPVPGPFFHSPAALRFTWQLEGGDNETFPAGQQSTWRYRFDYDVARQVVRPDREPLGLDGAYLASGDHRVGLRSAPYYGPLPTADSPTPIRLVPLLIDVYPSAGGPGPGPDPSRFAPPLILEAVGEGAQFATSGYTISGDLVFLQEGTPEDEPGPPGDGDPGAPSPQAAPRLWQALLVVGLALLVTVPRLGRDSATNP